MQKTLTMNGAPAFDASSGVRNYRWDNEPFPNGLITYTLEVSGSIGCGFRPGTYDVWISESYPNDDGTWQVSFKNNGASTTGSIWVFYN